jgi:Tfp pilus assembly protein FimT
MSAFLLVAIPNIVGIHETYLLRTNTSGLVSYLKLSRMKAVANNLTYIAQVDPTVASVRDQCRASVGHSVVAVYRDLTPDAAIKVEQCFTVARGIKIAPVTATMTKAAFKANGMCEDKPAEFKKAPNHFVLTSRNGRMCQLVCTNIMGAVYFNPPYEIPAGGNCSDNSYNATASTPCPQP